ncbi:MAG: hypothetical protein WEF50_12845 [Myxococcota bacterium]
MKTERVQYCLRMTRAAYEDATDVALVFDMSLNQFFLGAIRSFVDYQLCQESTRSAVAKIREARGAGLVEGGAATPAHSESKSSTAG